MGLRIIYLCLVISILLMKINASYYCELNKTSCSESNACHNVNQDFMNGFHKQYSVLKTVDQCKNGTICNMTSCSITQSKLDQLNTTNPNFSDCCIYCCGECGSSMTERMVCDVRKSGAETTESNYAHKHLYNLATILSLLILTRIILH